MKEQKLLACIPIPLTHSSILGVKAFGTSERNFGFISWEAEGWVALRVEKTIMPRITEV